MYRFAPSPTGDMHIGNLRAALVNFVCARQAKKGFILRIEDTDSARNIPGKDQEIQQILRAFGLHWDGFYVQSENYAHHRQLAAHLLRARKAFACTCSDAELEAEREAAAATKRAYRYSGRCLGAHESEADIEALCLQLAAGARLEINGKPAVLRLKKPAQTVKFHDEIKGDLSFEPDDIDSFVIMRADGRPMYNFACCCDDICEGVSMIIRGEDHVSNTPKQEHIRAQIGVDEPMKYAHLPIILNDEGKKMSKRDAASSVAWLLECGILPSAVANYLLLLGNQPPREIFSLEEAAEFFDITALSKAPARFDMQKLQFINREHLKRLSAAELARLVFKEEFLREFAAKIESSGAAGGAASGDASGSAGSGAANGAKISAEEQLGELAKIYLEEASSISELSGKLAPVFLPARVIFGADESCENFEHLNGAKTLAKVLAQNPEYADIKALSGLAGKQLFKPLRLLLSGAQNGPELAKIYEALRPILAQILELRAL